MFRHNNTVIDTHIIRNSGQLLLDVPLLSVLKLHSLLKEDKMVHISLYSVYFVFTNVMVCVLSHPY